ncbi:short-chain dehydrogenase [Xylogone sp. PMI_703]|nr:short-chain dehydrogenase [Xylogone sp. PMI_703]
MASEKVIIVTGASRGIGLAIAQYLLRGAHKLVVVARTEGPLVQLKKEFPGQVEVLAVDVASDEAGRKAVSLAVDSFSRLDGLIINHGTLGNLNRIADSAADDFRKGFDVNYFSAVSFIAPAIPHLRKTKGRIILNSSGAATMGYITWGMYGASKAALNHLAMTLAAEEPDITTVAIEPGIVATEMQREIRESTTMDPEDRIKFRSLDEEGKLLRPEQPGNVIAKLTIEGDSKLSGKFFSWDSEELAAYRDS